MTDQTLARLTAAEYFATEDYATHDLIELINGEVVIRMPPNLQHQEIVGEIFAFLRNHARQHGGKAYVAPTEVSLGETQVFEPDVIYLVPETRVERTPQRIVGPPELVVEVLSPSTAKRDRQDKYQVYEAAGVREYWIVDPVHATLEVWVLTDGAFKRQGAFEAGNEFTSTVLGQAVAVKAFLGK